MKGLYKDYIVKTLLFCSASASTAFVILITIFLFFEGASAFEHPINFILGTSWQPTNENPLFGAFPLIVGSIFVTFLAILFSLPIGFGCALFISELIPKNTRRIVKPSVELLAGIPSVVYGFFGLVVLTEWISVTFSKPSGESWLAGSIILAIMALPTIVSVSDDALNSVPREYIEGSLALGSTRWQAIWRVAIPSSIPGITAAVVLGIGRAIGETMAVMMVTGNSAIIPKPLFNVFSPVRTLTGTIAIEMGEVPSGSAHYHALFGLGIILFLIVFLINFTAHEINHLYKKRKLCISRIKPNTLFSKTIKVGKYAFLGVVSLSVFYLFGILTASLVILFAIPIYYISKKTSARICEKFAFSLIYACGIFVISILGIVLFYLASHGLGAISLDFLTQSPRRMGREGGIFPAIIGTLLLVTVAISASLPIGIGAGIYLSEYSRESTVTKMLRIFTDNLNGTPSIVFGLFGFAFFVLYLNLGVSLIAGGLTLAMMILPTIIRTTEEAVKAVPQTLREGSLALGASKWTTIQKVVLPSALPGIATGTILSIGRAAGETAPIMFTAVVFSQRLLPNELTDPVMALPYHLFVLVTNVPNAETNAYGTALVLLMLVLGMNLFAILIREKYQKYAKW